jgi:hypothetical protein
MKKLTRTPTRPLTLHREVVRNLTNADLAHVAGGGLSAPSRNCYTKYCSTGETTHVEPEAPAP